MKVKLQRPEETYKLLRQVFPEIPEACASITINWDAIDFTTIDITFYPQCPVSSIE